MECCGIKGPLAGGKYGSPKLITAPTNECWSRWRRCVRPESKGAFPLSSVIAYFCRRSARMMIDSPKTASGESSDILKPEKCLTAHNRIATQSALFACKSEQSGCYATAPRVSVVMGAYNGERFLRPAIESILSQTFRDFELIVIDDYSTDSTPRILREFKDARMRVLRNERNLGIAKTLNNGIAAARGEYVALQDHDDISWPTRLEYQVAFFDKHAQVGMVGSSCNVIDEVGTFVPHWPVEYDDVKLRWALLWRCPFFHTAVMVRRRAIEEVGGYSSDPRYRFAEDYDLMLEWLFGAR